MRYADAMQAPADPAPDAARDGQAPAIADADLAWRLARKNVHIAFSNFAEAFYRMMSEPKSHQVNVPELNNLLIQNHVLASQITAAIPTLAALPQTPARCARRWTAWPGCWTKAGCKGLRRSCRLSSTPTASRRRWRIRSSK